jgi:hypothetical protein
VPVYLDLPPLLAQDPVRIDEKSTAFDAADLLAVHVLVLDDIELLTELLVGVRYELER